MTKPRKFPKRRIIGESNIWRINQKIVVGVTLIWRKAVAVIKHNSYRPEMALLKFEDKLPNRQIKHTANYSAYAVY